MKLTARAGVLALLACAGIAGAKAQQPPAPPPAATPAPVDYDRDVRPILERHCYECHGAKKSRGKLRLHTQAFITRGGSSGAAVVPGRSDESLLVRRVLGLDDEDRMPLDGDPLPDAAIETIKTWIAQGAGFGAPGAGQPVATAPAAEPDVVEHWAYVKPRRHALPPVSNDAWVRNPIDRFVLARLDREKLAPAPRAERATLLRRVSLDLVGLPPTLEELEAFEQDRSADAFDKVVDRLLASPHYGERWARPWLDLARYADTNGHEKDNRRSIWKYRDWVIDALNRDLPFDQFTVEQLAGDMLPRATVEQRIATGFHRNAMTNEEGGVDPAESMYEVLVDRVNTTATVWLGSTLACAQCHNHKYDPFSQKDYFRFLAFFAGADYDVTSSGDGTRFHEAKLDLASEEQETRRREAQATVDRLQAELKQSTPELAAAQADWERTLGDADRTWTPLAPQEASATGGVRLTVRPDASIVASGANAELTTYTVRARTASTGLTGLRLEALPDPSLPRGGPGRDAYGHFRLTGIHVEVAPASKPSASSRLAIADVKVNDSAYAFEARELVGLASEAAGYARKRGAWAVNAMRDPDTRVPRHATLRAEAPFGFAGGTIITVRLDHRDGTIGQGLGRFRLSVTDAADPLVGATLPARLRPVLAADPGARATAPAEELASQFRTASPLLAETRARLAAAREALAKLQIPSTLVMKERASFERPSYELRERGSFTARGARMFAATPSALHRLRDDLPANRLGLARWLVDPENPLVARVAVNRLWEQIFGRGLVLTSEDFGTQGEPPSHPDLLDWLATELVERGWSQKAILKTIVSSATYQQSSVADTALVERDPDNRLLARGPRFRMEAEMIRDVALAASGLLSRKTHGPSVFPPQPDGIWDIPYNQDKWVTSDGEDRYRRSLYTFLRRTSPYPSFMTFDATSREFCTVRRVRTNTPLQALTLLNDRAAFEAARALAARMRSDPAAGQSPAERASHGFRLCTSRAPEAAEIARLVALYEDERRHYGAAPEDARKVAASTDLAPDAAADVAAWTIVANVMLNLDETLTKN
jgi:hypothetical protein